MTAIKNKRILKCLLMMFVSQLVVLNFLIGVSASSNYDRQKADACINISQRLSVEGGNSTTDYVDIIDFRKNHILNNPYLGM